MALPLPMPTLDHVVVNVRDRIDLGAETYRRLGFILTPRGYHTLGSMNHLAIFGTDYLELIAAPAGETRRPDVLERPEGLNGLVFGSEESAATYAALREAGVPVEPPLAFSRPVEVAGGMADAAFRTVHVSPGVVSCGRIYFCHHLTRALVWRDEWRHHPNGVIGVVRAVIASNDPSVLGGLFGRMFGTDAVHAIEGGVALSVGLSRFEVVTHAELGRMFGDAAPDAAGRAEFMAALTFRTRSADAAAAVMAANRVAGVRHTGNRVLVPAGEAFGATLEFMG